MSNRTRAGLLILVAVLAGIVLVTRSQTSTGSKAATGSTKKTASSSASTVDPTTVPSTTAATAPTWRVVWGSPMAWGYGVVDNATVRNLAVVATAGSEIRFRVSNVFGNQPLQIGAATVAPSAGGSAIDPTALHHATFSGSPQVTIPVGGLVYSDPVPLAVTAGEAVDISLWISGTDLVSVHPYGINPDDWFTRNGGGDHTTAATMTAIGTASTWNRFVDAIDALQTTGHGSIVVLGDSITDGFHSTARWTDIFQRRVDTLAASQRRAVINEGITANALTSPPRSDALLGGGPPGVSRLTRDVLSQAGVSEVVILLGTNDLWFGASSAEVIAGYQNVVAQVHAAGLPIVAMTLLPRSTDTDEYWSPADEANLEAVDHWIRTSDAFNAVIDTARVVAAVYNGQCDPHTMFAPFDSGDHLHPNAAGQTAIANFIDPKVLGLPPLPKVPPLVPATPTPGCAYAPSAAA